MSASPTPSCGCINVFWDDGMLSHDTGRGVFHSGVKPTFLDVLEKHPENSDRVKNMVSILKRGPISSYISWHSGRSALLPELLSFHTQEYVNKLVEADRDGGREICYGTFLNPGSWDAALLAAGTTLSAMKHILDGHGRLAYALVRPPGHHAQPTQADGYCFLNNAGLAVKLALDSGCRKVAVIDIDAHHGNGTAEGFYRSSDALTISLHMNHGPWGPSHPQMGLSMNLVKTKAIEKFKPDMIVLVIGQDSSAFDPNGRQCLTMDGYREIGRIIRGLADKHCDGRLLIVQEGGYHVTYSAYCLHATLEGVLNLPLPLLSDPIAYYPEDEAFAVKVIESIKRYHRETVPFLKEP
ncbi:hypothetical protein SLA2020_364510 [Shorea laevis]